MAGALGDQVGGIAGLSALLSEHGEAVEADLLRQGIRLSDIATRSGVKWRRLRVLVTNLPPGSATWRAMNLSAAWTDEAHLMATAVDVLAAANWQRSKDGQKGTNRPKPLQRPGSAPRAGVHKYGKAGGTLEQRMAFLASIGPKREKVDDAG